MNHTPKKHWLGCAVATAAVLSGRRYEDVFAHWPDLDVAESRSSRELCALLEAVTDRAWYLEPCWEKPEVINYVPPDSPVAVWIQNTARGAEFGHWIVIHGDVIYDSGEPTECRTSEYPRRNWVVTEVAQDVPPKELVRLRDRKRAQQAAK
jgi:hypothetical protein